MNIPGYSVKRPVTVVVLYVLALGVAATLVPNLAVDLYPSVSMPVLSVFTQFSGAGPEDVEKNLTEPLERALSASQGLADMSSVSQFGSSMISLQYDYGTDMDKAASDAQTLLNRLANSLPSGAGAPTVRRFDMGAMPIMRLVVRGNYPADQLRLLAEEQIQAGLERLDGVASAEVTGGTTQVVNVEVSLNRLAAFNLTLADVSAALRGQSVLSSGGSLRRGTREYQIMTQEELVSVDQIKRLVVKTISVGSGPVPANRSQLVRLEDIADIGLDYNDNAARVYVNGETGVYIQVTAESDSNQVKVADRVQAALADINQDLPGGITLEILSDNTTMIRATLEQVYINAAQGAVLAMLILLLFLRNIRGTLIIGLTIPISIVLTLMFMSIFGFTLNMLTMIGLIMALGMTVDGTIVILENVHSYRERGAKPDIAAILGSREMLRAIIASSATTLCVFVPLIIYKNDLEQIGQLASDLIFTVIISLVCSLVVAVTLVPSLCGAILKLNTRKQKPLKNPFARALDNGIEGFFRGMENRYRGALEYCLSHRLLIVSFVLVLFVFSMLQFGGLGMNMYMRTRTDDNVSISVSLPQGTTVDVVERTLFEVEGIVKENIQGYNNIILTARSGGTTQGTIQITLPAPALQIDTPDAIIRKLTPLVGGIPGAQVRFSAGRGMGSGSAVAMTVSSRNYTSVTETAEEIRDIMARYLPEIENPVVNSDEGAPQLTVEINRERAAALGISLSSVASEIRTAMNGSTVTTISGGDKLLNVNVKLRDADRQGLPNLDAVFVLGRGGQRVSLSNVARIVENRASSSIRRENQERLVRITGDLPEGIAATDMQRRLEETVKENLVSREDVDVRYQGEAQEVDEYMRRFYFIIAIAVFLVFCVMASQFESFVDPLIIFFSIPLLAIGVVWIYKFAGQAMSMFSVLGIVALVGVVVNNGIILVDYTNTLRARGMKVREACLEAGRSRLRPILMTSLTTILGMFPIAFFPGVGADSIQPIGMTFVGGLTVSSIMTLFVTPVMYSLLNSRHDRKREKQENARRPAPAENAEDMLQLAAGGK
ncbi:MAG: efflux RND transporter permease subunit [Treponema sp.]|nr:efflux RND transporter permease subunit [Treponema sp.]